MWRALSGADLVVVNSPGLLRFSEKSAQSGALDNSRPAALRTSTSATPPLPRSLSAPRPPGRTPARFVHFNVWRALSPPPQDVPLAVCDARTYRATT